MESNSDPGSIIYYLSGLMYSYVKQGKIMWNYFIGLYNSGQGHTYDEV